MKMRSVGLAVIALVVATSWARPASAVLCSYDSKEDGSGVLVKWPTMPVAFYINVTYLPAEQQAPAIEAIQKAFKAYELTCSTLKFNYKGPSTSVSDVADGILVYFSDVAGSGAYFYKLEWNTAAAGDINKGIIMMNSKNYGWSVGAEASKIDIQTAVTQMIPGTIGFYAGGNPWTGSLDAIKYNFVQTDLTQEQKDGVLATYPESGCTPPATPSACKGIAVPEGGIPKPEGGVNPGTDGGVTPKSDGSVTPKGDGSVQPTGDGSVPSGDGTITPKDDDGCCRVSHARSTSRSYLILLGLGIVALLFRRRRRG